MFHLTRKEVLQIEDLVTWLCWNALLHHIKRANNEQYFKKLLKHIFNVAYN